MKKELNRALNHLKSLEITIDTLNAQIFELLSNGGGCVESIEKATAISQAVMYQTEHLQAITDNVHQLANQQTDKLTVLTEQLNEIKRIEQK